VPPKCAETIYHPSHADEEIVHTSRKLLESGRNLLDITSRTLSLAPTPAALGDIEWRCKNLPKRGTLNSSSTDMPAIGEVRRASELGYRQPSGHDCLYTYAMCTRCSRTRWVRNQDLKTGKGLLCRSCSHTTTLPYTRLQQQVNKLREQVEQQGSQIRLLKWHIRELEQANPVARREGIPSQTSVETVQEARLEDDEETVHS